ncbi:MAG: lysophospholipid acyltransferase family protein [Gammaproteobacteria bacterium]|nr:lysophospholipid acyltransferase family protein [Gammaproteobacteria bacterium]
MLSWLSSRVLKALGWRLVGQPPSVDKCVLIFAPHTSNWDVIILLLLKWGTKLKPTFIGKHTLFWPPLSWFFRAIGGEPVDRTKTTNVVDQIVQKFNSRETLHFALSPEGTRSKRDHWKTGFYWVAHKAKVPIQLVFLDTATKTIGFGPLMEASGNIEKDFEFLHDFYHDKKGFRPELLSDIRLKSDVD